jgi:hypothetical protein
VTVEKRGGLGATSLVESEVDFVSGLGHFGHDVENRFGSVFEDGLRLGVLLQSGPRRLDVRTKTGIDMDTPEESRVSRSAKEGRIGSGERTGKSPALNPAAETGRREMWC